MDSIKTAEPKRALARGNKGGWAAYQPFLSIIQWIIIVICAVLLIRFGHYSGVSESATVTNLQTSASSTRAPTTTFETTAAMTTGPLTTLLTTSLTTTTLITATTTTTGTQATTSTTGSSSCRTHNYVSEGVYESCVFPWIYSSTGATYLGCTDRDNFGPWCATAVNATGFMASGAWGYCQDGCQGSLSSVMCGTNVSKTNGTVTSPSYSNNYPNNTSCTTVITVPSGFRINIVFTVFQLEENHDFLKLYNGNSSSAPIMALMTGLSTPSNSFTTSDNQLFLQMTSDAAVQKQGFSFDFKATNTIPATNVTAG